MAAPHSPETKAAVMTALLAGQSINSVAREYQLSKSTVSAWKNEAESGAGSNGFEQKTRDEIGDLLADYLRELLTTLSVQATFARDTGWLAKQGASELAVLHGVLTDKAVRILEAAERASGGD